MEPQTHPMYHYNTFGGFKCMIVVYNVRLSMLTSLLVTSLISCLKPTTWDESNRNLQGTSFDYLTFFTLVRLVGPVVKEKHNVPFELKPEQEVSSLVLRLWNQIIKT